MVVEENDDPPVPDLRTVKELCQPSLNGRGGPIAPIGIQATNFGLKNDMIQQVQNSCQYYGLLSDDANKHLDKFLHVTQSIKVNGVIDEAIHLYLFPHSLTHHATACHRWPDLERICYGSLSRNQGNHNPQGNNQGNHNPGPMILTTSSSSPIVERETEATKDTMHPTNNRSTKDVQPIVVQTESPILNSEPVVAPIIKHIVALVNLNFNISFADALVLRPKFGPTIKTLLTKKDKAFELARTLLNEHCSVVLLKKFREKLGDPDKFLIPYDFPRMAECFALADPDASINLMPLLVWNKLSLLDLSPTCITLELADCLISHPVGVAKDVFIKVGTFHFPADFVVVDFDVDPRVPLILGRSFLKTRRDFIDVFKGKLTLCVGKEAITFNLDQTSRYSANYNDTTANRIDIIDMACEECSQEFLGFSDVITSGNPTPYYDPYPTLTPFGESDFLLEEVDAFLALEDDSTSPKVEHKDLPPHLEYSFLEGDDKLPIIIAIDLSVEEKTGLITVLKSHKRAIALKLFDIKGIDPKFCTPKILMEEDFKPVVQHRRRVNPKIYDVIKQEVLKLLDAKLIYPIFDSPWQDHDRGKVQLHHNIKRNVSRSKDSKARLLRWVLLLQEFTFKVIDTKGAENLAADHLF
nr:reverse transcriptase domain-containing protein [Tanacetum cinerariifolium]